MRLTPDPIIVRSLLYSKKWHTIALKLPGKVAAVRTASDMLSADKVRQKKAQSRHRRYRLCGEKPKDHFGSIASHNG